MKLELAIDRIVLDGLELSPHETRRLRHALENELGRLLGDTPAGEVPRRDVALTSLAAPGLSPASAAAGGSELGRSLAQSIHAALAPQLAPGVGR